MPIVKWPILIIGKLADNRYRRIIGAPLPQILIRANAKESIIDSTVTEA